MARDNAGEQLFGSAFRQGAFSDLVSSAVLLGLWAVLSIAVIVQMMLPLSVVTASPSVERAGYNDPESARPQHWVSSRPADSAQGRRAGSRAWVVASALAGPGGSVRGEGLLFA